MNRLERDQEVVNDKLPASARYCEINGISGWFYSIVSEARDEYQMYVYWDADTGLYKVKMVFPEVDPASLDPHRQHLFQNGDICLAHAVGLPTLEGAYAKSVLFANAWSFVQRGYGFPFSVAGS